MGGFTQETVAGNANTRFALDGLEQKPAGVGGDGPAQGRDVAKGNRSEARGEWTKSLLKLPFCRKTDDADGPAVEIVLANNNLRLVFGNPLYLITPAARRFDGGFHRFGTGVHRQSHVIAGKIVQFFVEQGELCIAEGA